MEPTNYDTKYSEPIGPPPAYPTQAPQQAPPPAYPGQGQPPPPPSYAPAQPAYPGPAGTSAGVHNTTVVVGQPTPGVNVVHPSMFRDVPLACTCPQCNNNIVTNIEYKVGTVTWLACIFLWFIGLGLGCCFIPFCLDVCKDCVHTCPNCNNVISTYNRM